MRIRKKFTFIFIASLVSFFIVFYIYINNALPTSNKPVTGSRGDYELPVAPEVLKRPERQKIERPALQPPDDVVGVEQPDAETPKRDFLNAQDLRRDDMIPDDKESNECPASRDYSPPDIQMLDVYKELAFDNPDGGVWKQGWDITYDPKHWNAHQKLKVFVVPHSHNDPGWLKTFDAYYESETRLILSNMLRHLDENPEMRFIWAEISYFSRWYELLAEDAKRKVKSFIKRKQLEFVTGGWVMNDEANSHWLSILQQLSEGQTWLWRHLNVTPTAHWSIDPFGYSPTQALLVKGTGIKNMLIQRAHYSIKKRFAQQRTLEFRWRQLWDSQGSTELLTHLMPFYSYDVPHTCGPDPKICCQFDFKRLPGYGVSCPWRVAPKPITDRNVAAKAEVIVDQWRKKSMLYKTRSVLIPLGDDFRYSQSSEWVAQMENYGKLFEFINSEAQLNVEAKFATLQEYFDSVKAERAVDEFPSFSGDFFTYADKDDNYWSGYYTSRPYHKRFDRVLMGYLRSAEMLHAWQGKTSEGELNKWLENGRRALALFQHHDGVTGTAKDHVVQDYERIMMEATRDLKNVIQQSVYRLLTQPSVYQGDMGYEYLTLDDFRSPNPDESRPTLILGEEMPTKHVVVHNSLPYEREELVNFYLARPFAMVMDSAGLPVACQFEPVWRWHKDTHLGYRPQVSNTKFKLSFKAKVPPMGLKVFTIQSTINQETSHLASYAQVTVYTEQPFGVTLGEEYPGQVEFKTPEEISLKWEEFGAGLAFNKEGLLKSMSLGEGQASVPVHLEFLQYGVKRQQESSGAYLFMPDGPATPLHRDAGDMGVVVVVTRGDLTSSVASGLDFGVHSVHWKENGAVELQNLVDVKHMLDTEVVMRLSTHIKSGQTFYTDLNGLQWIKRERFEKLPIQANYYPVPSGIFIEDKEHRLTVLSGQSLGGSSLREGQVEIMQDRRLQRDDNRGLGQGVMDNRKTLHVFRLVLEKRSGCAAGGETRPWGSLTRKGQREAEAVTYPMERMVFTGNEWNGMVPQFGEGRDSAPGVQVAVMRHLPVVKGKRPKEAMGMVLHRPEVDRCGGGAEDQEEQEGDAGGEVNLSQLLGVEGELYEAQLNLVQRGKRLEGDTVSLCSMEVKGVMVVK